MKQFWWKNLKDLEFVIINFCKWKMGKEIAYFKIFAN